MPQLKAPKPPPVPNAPFQTRKPTERANRRYMSLNLTLADYEIMAKLAEFEHCSVTEAIRRSTRTRWAIVTASRPELRWPDLPPEQRREPERFQRVGILTGNITELDIL